MKLLKWMFRLSVFFGLFGSVVAKEADKHIAADFSWWAACGGSVLALEILVGFLAWLADWLPHSAFCLLHIPAQFLPLMVNFLPGWVDCETGLWWPVHWTYTLVLVLSMPGLTQSPSGSKQNASIPLMDWCTITSKGSYLAQAYFYVTSFLSASDQYLDSMTAAIALQCEWRLAWMMVSVIFVSLALQALAAAVAAEEGRGLASAINVLAGTPPEAMLGGAGQGALMTRHQAHEYAASQGLAKLVTENGPQAYLAIKFAKEVKPSPMVWFSVAMSLALATKAAIGGLQFFCGCTEEDEESEEEEEEEEEE